MVLDFMVIFFSDKSPFQNHTTNFSNQCIQTYRQVMNDKENFLLVYN